MNDRLTSFLKGLREYGVAPRLMWETKAWDDSDEGTSPAPTVSCYLFCSERNQSDARVPHMGIFTSYPDGGYDFFPIAKTNTQRGDLAIITGQSETALEMAGL